MLNWLGGLMDRIFAVIGAIVFAQAPLFMQQYTQQLIGREAELRLQVDSIRQSASLSHKTLEQLIQKFVENSDMDFVRQGEMMQTIVGRWHHLSDALQAMQESSIWSKPFAFISHLNIEAFQSTFHNFRMGLPFTLEGGVYGLLGIAAGYLMFSSLRVLMRKVRKVFYPPQISSKKLIA